MQPGEAKAIADSVGDQRISPAPDFRIELPSQTIRMDSIKKSTNNRKSRTTNQINLKHTPTNTLDTRLVRIRRRDCSSTNIASAMVA